MNGWEKFSETSLPKKEDFFGNLNMEDITDADYTHEKIICKDYETKNLGEYHDLYVQSNILLGGVLENFRNTNLEIYKLDSARFITVPGLVR